MTTFSSLLSSIGEPTQASQQTPSPSASRPSIKRPQSDSQSANRGVSSTTVAAGIKRKSEEPDLAVKTKQLKLHQNNQTVQRPTAATSSRFQLSSKTGALPKPSSEPLRPTHKLSVSTSPHKSNPQAITKSATPITASGAPVVSNGASSGKRGFASIMEKAKAAQEAAKAAGSSGIKHKTVERLTKKERVRAAQEAHTKKAEGTGKKLSSDPEGRDKASAPPKKGTETGYKGTMKKAAAPLEYKGTMRKVAPGEANNTARKQKGMAQDKYGGYASWSDLDEAEDEEEGYDSEGSSDMDAGYDDLEFEEMSALRAAKKEDQEALEEEERLKREKLERKRKLEQLNKSAAARRKY